MNQQSRLDNWEDTFPLSTFYGETKNQLELLIRALLNDQDRKSYSEGRVDGIEESMRVVKSVTLGELSGKMVVKKLKDLKQHIND